MDSAADFFEPKPGQEQRLGQEQYPDQAQYFQQPSQAQHPSQGQYPGVRSAQAQTDFRRNSSRKLRVKEEPLLRQAQKHVYANTNQLQRPTEAQLARQQKNSPQYPSREPHGLPFEISSRSHHKVFSQQEGCPPPFDSGDGL